jgi:hypothetical protein
MSQSNLPQSVTFQVTNDELYEVTMNFEGTGSHVIPASAVAMVIKNVATNDGSISIQLSGNGNGPDDNSCTLTLKSNNVLQYNFSPANEQSSTTEGVLKCCISTGGDGILVVGTIDDPPSK